MFPTISARTAVIVVSFISPTCLSLRNNAACCIPLRDLRYLRENTRKSTQSICTKKPQCLPQISLIYADKTQNNKTALTSPNCLSLRDNAACCIPLRHLRDLRENIHCNLLNQYTQTKPQYLPLISQIYADKQQNNNTQTTCLSLRDNAACCIPLCHLRDLRENNTQEYSINLQTRNPNKAPADLADYADKNPTTTTITTKQH